MEKKCGICQKNKIQKTTKAWFVIFPVAASHPPTGGIAPGTAPIKVFQGDFCFIGV